MARKGKLLKKASASGSSKSNASSAQAAFKDENKAGNLPANRNLGTVRKPISGDLGGFIFMCNGSTKPDCFKYRVFGLNEGKKNLVEQVRKGMRLFLFDVDLRLLYGIYVASSQGTYKIEREAFGGSFPWQVRFSIQKDCLPLSEDIFQAAIKENYTDKRRFKVELTTEQVHRLVKLFRPLPPMGRSPPRPRMPALDHSGISLMPGASRLPEVDRYAQDLMLPRGLSPRSKYESSLVPSDIGRLPPLTKYDTGFIPSERYRAERQIPGHESLTKYDTGFIPSERYRAERQIPGHESLTNYDTGLIPSERYRAERQIPGHESLTKYAQLFPSEDRRMLEGRALDDLYLGRDLRLQRDVGSLVPGQSLAPSLLAVNADTLRPVSDLHKPRARDELLSVYPPGSTLGADVDLYRQRLRLPDMRGDLLERRVSGLDPLVESYSSGLSSELFRGRTVSDTYGSSTAGILGAPGLGLRGDIPPASRYY